MRGLSSHKTPLPDSGSYFCRENPWLCRIRVNLRAPSKPLPFAGCIGKEFSDRRSLVDYGNQALR